MNWDWQMLFSWIPGIAAVLGAVIAVVNARASARSTSSTAKKTDVEAQQHLIDNLRVGYDRIREENRTLLAEVVKLRVDYEVLTARYGALRDEYENLRGWAELRGWPGGVQK